VDAVTNIVVLARQKRPPRDYSQAGSGFFHLFIYFYYFSSEIDGMLVCFKLGTVPEGYGKARQMLTHSQSTELESVNSILKN
jgi:hypothetical protein